MRFWMKILNEQVYESECQIPLRQSKMESRWLADTNVHICGIGFGEEKKLDDVSGMVVPFLYPRSFPSPRAKVGLCWAFFRKAAWAEPTTDRWRGLLMIHTVSSFANKRMPLLQLKGCLYRKSTQSAKYNTGTIPFLVTKLVTVQYLKLRKFHPKKASSSRKYVLMLFV